MKSNYKTAIFFIKGILKFCSFNNVDINSDYQVTKGKIVADGADAQLLDDETQKIISEALDKADSIINVAQSYINYGNTLIDETQKVILVY